MAYWAEKMPFIWWNLSKLSKIKKKWISLVIFIYQGKEHLQANQNPKLDMIPTFQINNETPSQHSSSTPYLQITQINYNCLRIVVQALQYRRRQFWKFDTSTMHFFHYYFAYHFSYYHTLLEDSVISLLPDGIDTAFQHHSINLSFIILASHMLVSPIQLTRPV